MTSLATVSLFWGAIRKQISTFGLRQAGILGAIALTGSVLALSIALGRRNCKNSVGEGQKQIQKESVNTDAPQAQSKRSLSLLRKMSPFYLASQIQQRFSQMSIDCVKSVFDSRQVHREWQ